MIKEMLIGGQFQKVAHEDLLNPNSEFETVDFADFADLRADGLCHLQFCSG